MSAHLEQRSGGAIIRLGIHEGGRAIDGLQVEGGAGAEQLLHDLGYVLPCKNATWWGRGRRRNRNYGGGVHQLHGCKEYYLYSRSVILSEGQKSGSFHVVL
jgi:hypothetical protein